MAFPTAVAEATEVADPPPEALAVAVAVAVAARRRAPEFKIGGKDQHWNMNQ